MASLHMVTMLLYACVCLNVYLGTPDCVYNQQQHSLTYIHAYTPHTEYYHSSVLVCVSVSQCMLSNPSRVDQFHTRLAASSTRSSR